MIAALPVLLLAPAVLGVDGEARDSLQELLRQARAQRDAAQALLRPEVEARIAALDGLERSEADGPERARIIAEVVGLGPEAVPLLVPYIDPDATPGTGNSRKRRAQAVTSALLQLPSVAITDELIALASDGSAWRRANALELLGASTERARVVPVLLEILRSPETSFIRLSALEACARQGGSEEQAAIAEALHDPEDALVSGALIALASIADANSGSIVLALARDAERGPRFAAEISDYFAAVPSTVDDDVVESLLVLAAHPETADAASEHVLAQVPAFEPGWEPAWARALEPLTDRREGPVHDAALICLARLGSSIAKRDVLRTYDDLVDQDPNWSNAYVQRAKVLVALEEFRLAIKDWRKALELSRAPVDKKKVLWVALAHANALDGNFREAQKVLQGSPLTSSEIRALKHDPDFAEMAAHSRYGKLFE